MEKSEFIDFNLIRSGLNLDSSLFALYLKEIFADLSTRPDGDKEKGMSKITFNEYLKVPVFINKKIFSSMDKDNDNFLTYKEFYNGMMKIFTGSFEETAQMIFSIYDFDKDGIIRKSDVKLLLSYLPIKSNDETNHKHQMESLEELDEILLETFGKEENLNLENYLKIIETKKSDIYLQLICFIYNKKPFETDSINQYSKLKKNARPSKLKVIKVDIDKEKRVPSPSKKTKFQPAETYLTIKLCTNYENSNSCNTSSNSIGDKKNKEIKTKSPNPKSTSQKNNQVDAVRMPNRKLATNSKSNVKEILQSSKDVFLSPSHIIKSDNYQRLSEFNLEDNLKQLNIEEDDGLENKINYEDWVYFLESGKLKKIYTVLIGKEINFYVSNTKDELISIQNLSGCFLKDYGSDTKTIEKSKYFGFSILISKDKVKTFYFSKIESKEKWCSYIKKAIGYETFSDLYEVNSILGEGLFGVVKKGLRKKTNEIVAVKIITKEKLRPGEIDLIRTEIDLMKFFKHPNIVKLIDHFECSEYIYIVMPCYEGGNLIDYLEKNNKSLNEKLIAKIIYHVGSAIKYINSYGVIHRDLKSENIMLSDNSENPQIKIIDFGLTRTLADGEKLADGFGTITYVSPEVLTRKPYNKQIDIWSMGVILYFLLSGGKLPFDDDDDEKIAKKAILMDPSFPNEYFGKTSKSAINLINECLVKDPEKRITIENFLKNDWIKKNMKD